MLGFTPYYKEINSVKLIDGLAFKQCLHDSIIIFQLFFPLNTEASISGSLSSWSETLGLVTSGDRSSSVPQQFHQKSWDFLSLDCLGEHAFISELITIAWR